MLFFVGIGISSELDLSLKAIEILKKCDIVYLEYYTQPLVDLNINNLEKLINKKIIILEREDVENRMLKIIKEGKEKNVALLIGGDPFVATTHNIYIPELIKRGVKYKVVHSSSVFTSVCKSGLEIYKFGEIITIPFHYNSVLSPIEKIKRNKENGLHSLVLLDLNKKENKYLDVKDAIEYLLKYFDDNEKIIVFSRIGSEDEKIVSGELKELLNKNLGEPPYCLIIPGKMNIIEKECFNCFLGND